MDTKRVSAIKTTHAQHWVGDGFPVRSIFGYTDNAEARSPFLLMDYAGPYEFSSTSEQRGVGPHPHRGFETVTLLYAGGVSHRDSAGGGGTLGPGDVQWMTAGSGVLHTEFHSPEFSRAGGSFEAIQLWINLPAAFKMSPPRYQEIPSATIPKVPLPDSSGFIRVIAGEYNGIRGPAETFTPMDLWDVSTRAGHQTALAARTNRSAALFVLEGRLRLSGGEVAGSATLVLLTEQGAGILFETLEDARILFMCGDAIPEPIVGHGPFVMNSESEIREALEDWKSGRFGEMPSITTET